MKNQKGFIDPITLVAVIVIGVFAYKGVQPIERAVDQVAMPTPQSDISELHFMGKEYHVVPHIDSPIFIK